jgi:hypothetical protein
MEMWESGCRVEELLNGINILGGHWTTYFIELKMLPWIAFFILALVSSVFYYLRLI